MATTEMAIDTYCHEMAEAAKEASRVLPTLPGEARNRALSHFSRLLREEAPSVMEANQKDLEAAPSFGLTGAQVDRLRLTPQRLGSMADAVDEIIMLADPVGRVIDSSVRPNGLNVMKVRVPLGVVFFIYESRPNVTADAAALCLKSGNAVILRGGKEARHSNIAVAGLIQKALAAEGLPNSAVQMVGITDREAVGEFLRLNDFIDVAIPRGGAALIRRVADEATMPVIKHFQGICHVYVDASADKDKAVEIVENSKCHRPGVCNAAETLLVHEHAAGNLLPAIGERLLARGVELRGCPRTCELIAAATPATEEDFDTEYLELILSVRVVPDIQAAMDHIAKHGSGHTETIVTEKLAAAQQFTTAVDSSAVFVNASTRFNDGGQFGLGAEIGISTDKFHARGPCGLNELTSYKYVAFGNGQIRT
ncbi:Gamma-glutamyl phosphate reductase [Planctomycetes bacterium Pan216]|uniref:Gamma-glutamyl phosphate reductase n=2 Tax=Kolteria novifilia TaxID=2527975 RepID=A0A518BBY4_9BACT|nr:Gamma-glutamyl phosphate reductase [Planctomycetes bacterium Pan216]